MAKLNGNKERGLMITGIVMNLIAVTISVYWICKIVRTVNEIQETMREFEKNMDTAVIRENLDKPIEEFEHQDSNAR